jgi:hypothetical protein
MSSLRACVAISQTAAPRPEIFDPGTQNGTISNQIVVLPDGHAGGRLLPVQDPSAEGRQLVIRSTDEGVTWSKRAIIVAPDNAIGETDPEPITAGRSSAAIPPAGSSGRTA